MQQEILNRIAGPERCFSVAVAGGIPMVGSRTIRFTPKTTYREGSIPDPPLQACRARVLSTMRSRIIAGRDLTWAETYNNRLVALVSGEHGSGVVAGAACGHRQTHPYHGEARWSEVIGVVADLRDNGVDQKAPGIVYWPLQTKNFAGNENHVQRSVAIVIRTPRAGSTSFLQEVRQAVWSVNANLPLANVQTMEAVYDRSLARTSFTLVLLATSAA
jgi:hypothetical protein